MFRRSFLSFGIVSGLCSVFGIKLPNKINKSPLIIEKNYACTTLNTKEISDESTDKKPQMNLGFPYKLIDVAWERHIDGRFKYFYTVKQTYRRLDVER